MSRGKARKGGIAGALRADSSLRAKVLPGLDALRAVDRKRFDREARGRFVDSVDADEAMKAAQPNARRWDYVLGDGEGARLVGVEPHPAESGEVSSVIEKKANTERWLRDHLRDGERVERRLWVGTGKTSFPLTDRVRLRLAQAGIRFTGRSLRSSHLD